MEKVAYLQMAETEQQHWWFSGRRAISEGMISHHLTESSLNRILEIGAGTGGNLSMLQRFGLLSATEMDDDARRIAIARCGVDVLPGSLPNDLPVFSHKFDLVCLFDVLEHVDDDAGSLAAIRELMTPGGLLLLTVPAHPWLWSRHDEILHHKRRYTRQGLQAAIEKTGLTTRRLCFFNAFLFPAAVLGRVLDRLLPRQTSVGTQMPPRVLNYLLARTFKFEAKLLDYVDLPFGVSIIALLERR